MDATLGKVAVVGAGAVGSYYGARLARAGEDVHFLLRRDFEAVRDHGLTARVKTAEVNEAFTLKDVRVYRKTEDIGPVDWVVVGLKATARKALVTLLPPLLGPRTSILMLQNGLGIDEWAAEKFGGERILGGPCFVCLNRTAPAVVKCYHPGSVSIGEFDRPLGARGRAVGDAFNRAGVKCLLADNLLEMRWRKLVWNVPFNGLSIAAGGMTTDLILADPELRNEVNALMREIQRAAAVFGFEIKDDFVQQMVSVTEQMGPYKPSSMIDYLAGRSVEVEAIWGEPLRRAGATGVSTPHLERLYHALRKICETAPQRAGKKPRQTKAQR